MMLITKFIADIVMGLCGLFLAFLSLKKWFSEEKNHDYIFFWGFSFILLVGYSIVDILKLTKVMTIPLLTGELLILSYLLQARAVSLTCADSISTTNELYRKIIRIINYSIIVIVIILSTVIAFKYSAVCSDRIFELIAFLFAGIMSLIIGLILPDTQEFSGMILGYIALAVAYVTQTGTIVHVFDPVAVIGAETIKIIGIMLIFIDIYQIVETPSEAN